MPIRSRIHQIRSQAGDTIVEVLISIAVVSLVLVGAFVVSNHSLATVQDSNEHTAATQFLQSQVEQLRVYIQGLKTAPTNTSPFCFDSSGTHTTTLSNCDNQVGGATFKPTITPKGNDVYDCVVQWDSILGGTAKEEIFYQVYPGN